MSGPTAGIFGLDPGLLIAYEAGQAAAEIAAGYAAEAERRAEVRAQRDAEGQARRHGVQVAQLALREAIRGEETRQRRLADSLRAVQAQLGEPVDAEQPLPAYTGADSLADLQAHLDQLRQARDALVTRLTGMAQRAAQQLGDIDFTALIAAAPDVDSQLAAFALHARLARRVDAATLARRRETLGRVLARVALAPGAPLPDDLATLAEEFLATLSDARAEALASELRLRIEHYNTRAAAAAAARVLEASLHDLGYDVEGIVETLFVEGGVAHFQKHGWNDYFVRLRVDAAHGKINFNVVRAAQAGADRAHEDMLAEERWCAEFPRLKETLAARGIGIEVTRMLAAGEVPVQAVDAASLPAFARDEAAPRAELKGRLQR